MFKKYFCIIISYPIFIASLLIKKHKSVWIFSSWHGLSLSDNPKAFYDYCSVVNGAENAKKLIWITKSRELARSSIYSECCYAYSLRGIYYQCVAGVAIYSDSVVENFFEHCITSKTLQVQTWHGVPLKKIRNDINVRVPGFYTQFLKFVFPFRYDNPDIVLNTGHRLELTLSKAFGVPVENIYSHGYPRNDQLKMCKHSEAGDTYNILYAPTYRTNGKNPFFEESYLLQLSDMLNNLNAKLSIKSHPAECEVFKTNLLPDNILIVPIEQNLNEILGDFDMLVSDYSGCIIDFLLLNRPIILFPYDYEEYKNNHGLYSHYTLLIDNLPVTKNKHDLLVSVRELVGSSNNNQILTKYFHDNEDANSSRRLYEEIYRKI